MRLQLCLVSRLDADAYFSFTKNTSRDYCCPRCKSEQSTERVLLFVGNRESGGIEAGNLGNITPTALSNKLTCTFDTFLLLHISQHAAFRHIHPIFRTTNPDGKTALRCAFPIPYLEDAGTSMA